MTPVQPHRLRRDGPGHRASGSALAARAERVRPEAAGGLAGRLLPARLLPVKATANLYVLRRAEFTNILYARQGRAATNDLADRGRGAVRRGPGDVATTTTPSSRAASGRTGRPNPRSATATSSGTAPTRRGSSRSWTTWRCPTRSSRPSSGSSVPAARRDGRRLDGSDSGGRPGRRPCPAFSPYQSQPAQYVDVFNQGTDAVRLPHHRRRQPWVSVTPADGSRRQAGAGHRRGSTGGAHRRAATTVPITVTGAGRRTGRGPGGGRQPA